MKFKTVAEAFNFYRTQTVQQIETRAQEIGQLINTDANANIQELNIELDGLKEAKANHEERSQLQDKLKTWTPIAGASTQTTELPTDADAILKTPEYRSAFFKSLQSKPLTDIEQRAYKAVMEKRAAFGTQATLAAVLPTQTHNEIIQKARGLRALVTASRNFSIPAKLSVPVIGPQSAATWHAEGAPVEGSDVDPVSVNFNAYELIKIFSISASASAMALDSFESYLTGELANCLLDAMEAALATGTGTDQGAGLSSITFNTTNSMTFAVSPAFEDFVATAALLKSGYGAGASWAMNFSTLYKQVYSLTDANGRPLFIQNAAIEGAPAYLLGKPVILSDSIADDTIYYGNFGFMGYNLFNVMVETSRESSFKSNLIDYRVTAVADCKPIVSEAFVKLSKA
ncbi:hypothetical protein SPSIL_020050 [Sporomusa silvacetica DSM 10669]|uniref:Phage capsid-like C-terminal domain-containing protein n=1 Tax=Sporomusa silvacetica DSM 10669 TaxID=1123289 RepID=A0ABZ3IKC2_9FIRM|nr:phage major capsid protein [Sporomusa silvacetica]OZC18742.1 phage capsid family protein [Sporomusa silvacetica DSM 10669]